MTIAEPIDVRIPRRGNSLVAWILCGYRLSPDHKAKLRIWNWLFKLAGRPEVNVRYANDARLRLDVSDVIQMLIAKDGYYESEVWETLASFATGNDVFWDVGGHIGSVAIRAALNPLVRCVHTFEPNPNTAVRLLANLKLNPNLHVIHQPVALGDRNETRTLFLVDGGNTGLASIVPQQNVASAPVECVTADDWIAAGKADPPSLMKIDVEGFEREVLTGAGKLLASGTVKAIVFEAEVDEAGRMTSDEIPKFLGSFGYAVRHLKRPDGLMTLRENYLAELPRKST